MSTGTRSPEELRRRVDELNWYHTLELAPGITTPGWFDTAAVVEAVGFPSSLSGRRCLDIGTFDGFWAFEMERRGASEVVAIDLLDPAAHDWPAGSREAAIAAFWKRKARGQGFEVAHEALGSSVRRRERSVYELDPDADGEFDFVYMGSLLLHLRDPVRALERVASVCRGEAILVDAVDPFLTLVHRRLPVAALDARGRPWWWKPNLAGLVRMAEAAGLTLVEAPRLIYIPPGRDQRRPRLRPKDVAAAARALVGGREQRGTLLSRLKGDPHGAIRVRPADV